MKKGKGREKGGRKEEMKGIRAEYQLGRQLTETQKKIKERKRERKRQRKRGRKEEIRGYEESISWREGN